VGIVMARLRYRAMYATSTAIGFVLWGAMAFVGGGRVHGAREAIRREARRHAIDAARKHGPYLAPLTVLACLTGVEVLIAWLVWRAL
jgi:hypothetical protein